MKSKKILIIDDEKNTRMTLSRCLEQAGFESETAVNAEEGWEKFQEQDFGLILLDLRMPGMGGMEFLRQARERRPEVRVVIITAYGTVGTAVEAMKLGAVDFLQKPFTPEEIREVVNRIIKRDSLEEGKSDDYETLIELAKRSATDRDFRAAREYLSRAIQADLAQAEAFNLLGVIEEVLDNHSEALKNYRIALEKDPTLEAARKNLDRATSFQPGEPIDPESFRPAAPAGKTE
jgi:DNA-binding NtrC family response regulator